MTELRTRVCLENAHFLALDKPAGWLSGPSRWGAQDERPCLGIELEKLFGRLWPVHRLDEEVTGLILYARTAEAHRAASLWFEGHDVRKIYSALSEGRADAAWKPGQEFSWESRILRGKKRSYESPHGKDARTRAVWLGEVGLGGAKAQNWRLEPLTGRSHQLRFELARHGSPILGDKLYGSTREFTGEGIALRSVRLEFSAEAARFDLPAFLEIDGIAANPRP